MLGNKDIRVLFLGSDDIASSTLESIILSGVTLVGVITVPDKPQGRSKKIIFNEVKKMCIERHIKLFQPNNLYKQSNLILEELKPNLIITCSYGKIVPENMLNYPIYKSVNIHPSLLPKYRGAAPIQHAILNNDKQTGVTLLYMSNELDAGDIICQKTIPLHGDETFSSLKEVMKIKIRELILENIFDLCSSSVTHFKQDKGKASYVQKISSIDELINWDTNAIKIYAKIRALYSKPLARTILDGINIKIINAVISNVESSNFVPGEIIDVSKSGILVATKDKSILVTELQVQGKKPQKVSSLINGNNCFKKGKIFEKPTNSI